MVSHLVGKYSNNNIPGTENIDNAINELLVRCLWHVSLKANIRKLFLWSDMNSHVAALKQRKQYCNHVCVAHNQETYIEYKLKLEKDSIIYFKKPNNYFEYLYKINMLLKL